MITQEALVVSGLVVSALGSGLPTLCRALLVDMLGQHGTGALFGTLALGEMLGFLACELGLGWLFGIGLRTWIGLPFFVGFIVAVGAGIATWAVRIEGDKNSNDSGLSMCRRRAIDY